MEHEASKANAEVSSICNDKDGVMTILATALDSFVCKVDKHKICQGVDDLGRVVCGIVVLQLP